MWTLCEGYDTTLCNYSKITEFIILSRIKQGVPCGSHQPAEPTVLEALTDNSLGVTQILEDWRYKYGQYEKVCILYA